MRILRRSFLVSLFFGGLSAFGKGASSQTDAPDDDKYKRDFVRGANEQWQKEHKAAVARAKAAERRGEFSSLSPPQALVPFKDWDYYYTRGFPAVWTPNTGQKYKPVAVAEGFVTDLASVPQWAWSSGIRPEGPYAYAAVIHDYLYWMQDRSRDEADEIFLTAMEDSKVDKGLRDRIFSAVRWGGKSAWENNARLKQKGERRLLREFPTHFTISWQEWKGRPGVFRD